MAALLIFHILGLYPVPSSNQLLIGSPMVSAYTLTNNFFNTSTTVTVKNFDSRTVALSPPAGSNVYVQNVIINGKASDTICWVTFEDLTRGGEIVIVVGPDVPETGCGVGPNALPDSLESGGFKF
jgi:putative alpha-1,2-mannosidase